VSPPLSRARRQLTGVIASHPTSTGTMTSMWAQLPAARIAQDIEAMKHAMIRAQAAPATVAMPIAAADAIIDQLVADPTERWRLKFNFRHGTGKLP